MLTFLSLFSWRATKEKQFKKSLKKILGFNPHTIRWYTLAFTHRSAVKVVSKEQNEGTVKNTELKRSNERLEFLGDAILSSLVAEIVFKKFPLCEEGFLTEMRAKMVNRVFLNELASKMGLLDFVNFDSKAFPKAVLQGSILGDAFEALIGAIYLDRGFLYARKFYSNKVLVPYIHLESLSQSQINYKSKLIEWGQKNGKDVFFTTINVPQDTLDKVFEIKVLVGDDECGRGQDPNKKNAEKKAAEKACKFLGLY